MVTNKFVKNAIQLTRDDVYRLTFNEDDLASDKTLSTERQRSTAAAEAPATV